MLGKPTAAQYWQPMVASADWRVLSGGATPVKGDCTAVAFVFFFVQLTGLNGKKKKKYLLYCNEKIQLQVGSPLSATDIIYSHSSV